MRPTTAARRRSWRLPAVIFAVVVAGTYLPVFRGKIPFPLDTVVQFAAWRASSPVTIPRAPVADIGDLVTAFYPFRAIAVDAVRHGDLPLWNPYMLAGAPFLANS